MQLRDLLEFEFFFAEKKLFRGELAARDAIDALAASRRAGLIEQWTASRSDDHD